MYMFVVAKCSYDNGVSSIRMTDVFMYIYKSTRLASTVVQRVEGSLWRDQSSMIKQNELLK